MKKITGILLLVLVIVIQGIAILIYWNREVREPDRVTQEVLWSTLAGGAEDSLVLDMESPMISQHFVNQHEQLNQFIVFFYHCEETDSGQVYVKLKDLEGNVYYEYQFAPQYMRNDVFCLSAVLEQGTELVADAEYLIEISVENMETEDYLEIGTILKSVRPSVFLEMEDGNTLFTKLDYTYIDMKDMEKGVKATLWVCLLIDSVLFLVVLGLIWKWKRLALLLFAAGITTVVGIIGCRQYVENHKWYQQNNYVAHAFGWIDGKSYLNALEAFEASYAGGHRVFEVDFAMTSDGKIVLKRDWENPHGLPQFENGTIPTLEEFKAAKIWDKYTTMDIEDLLQLMLKYPDIYIVTDSKSGAYKDSIEQFTQIVELLDRYTDSERKSIMDRLIVQLYNDDMYVGLEKITHFENYIYTLYQRGCGKPDELGEFCVDNEIPVVVIPNGWWTEEINETLHGYGLEVWVHTLNEKEDIEALLEKGVDGIYTDVTDLDELVVFE